MDLKDGMQLEPVYRIIDRKTGCICGSYSRAYHEVFDFESVNSARTANCHDMFKNKDKYKINKYRVVYELIEEGVDDEPK